MTKKEERTDFVPTTNEVVLAFVQPTGTDLDNIRDRLKESCHKVAAKLELIDLTDFEKAINLNRTSLTEVSRELKKLTSKEKSKSKEFQELSSKMHLGSLLRKHIQEDVFAVYGLAQVSATREKLISESEENNTPTPSKIVYLLDSLKHPEELTLLRKVYGKSFILVAVTTDKIKREINLKSRKGMSQQEVQELITRDEKEDADYGQQMTSVFEQADFFFNNDASQADTDRFIEVIFGNSKITPDRHEYFMQLAAATSALSGDLSRQVGALLISKQGEVLSMGCNEVPKFGGGQYLSPDKPDYRDAAVGNDPNQKRRDQMLKGVNDKEPKIRDMVKNITEFHRAVHAEMEAIISCARKGISTVGSTLYTTTYPCHNCAKHLINAGVAEVIYIEAYPKSLAVELHSDSIEESSAKSSSKMTLQRYQGVGPRKYMDFFSLSLSGVSIMKRKGENVEEGWQASVFDASEASPKFPLVVLLAFHAEKAAVKFLLDQEVLKPGIRREYLPLVA